MSSTAEIDGVRVRELDAIPAAPPPRRILFADHTATLGGGEMALLNLVKHLDRSRYVPVVVLFSEGALSQLLIEAGVETHVLPLAPSVVNVRKESLGGGSLMRIADAFRTAAYIWRLRKFIARSRIDLVHTNSLKSDVIAGIAARLSRTPLIWHVRDRIADDYLPRRVCQLFRLMARWLPDFVIANSRATLNTLNLRTHGTAIYSGTANGNARKIIHDGTRLGPNLPAQPVRANEASQIGLVGRIAPWKGQHVFIAAAAIITKRFPSARFQVIGSVMFGETEYERQLHELVRREGLEDSIEFTGFRRDVPQLIARLDVLVHASTTGEPFGQVIIEGMAASKPIVATNGGGVPEIVEDGVTGLLVPMGDAIALARAVEILLSDPQLASRMGSAGFERVEQKFTIKLTAARVQDVYDQVISSA